MHYKDLFLGLVVALITGAINGAAVMTITGFKLDREHLLGLGAAAVAGGLLNAAMFLKTPPNGSRNGNGNGNGSASGQHPMSLPPPPKTP